MRVFDRRLEGVRYIMRRCAVGKHDRDGSCSGEPGLSIDINNIHRAAFLCSLKILEVFIEALGNLKNPVFLRMHQLGEPVFVHLEILRRDIRAQLAANALMIFMSDLYHSWKMD